jgi:hypothetical protein
LGGFDRERIEVLLRERALGLTRTPPDTRPPSVREERAPEAPARATAAVLDPEPPLPPPRPQQSGTCGDCARAIGVARLRVVPDALRCIDCQRAFEAAGA